MNIITSYAYDYTLKLGLPPSLTGFHQFAQAVAAYVPIKGFPSIDAVYSKICKQYGVQSNTVAHAISYAFSKAPNFCDMLFELTGYKVVAADVRPKFIVCLVAQSVRRDLKELDPKAIGLGDLDLDEIELD